MDSRPSITLDPSTGALTLLGTAVTLSSGSRADAVRAALTQFYCRSINHNNGYEWLSFSGLEFAGRACVVSICFKQGFLVEVHWGLLTQRESDASWPSREDIDEEVAFIRSALAKLLFRSFASGSESFGWGTAWSLFDPKSFTASSGVRYA